MNLTSFRKSLKNKYMFYIRGKGQKPLMSHIPVGYLGKVPLPLTPSNNILSDSFILKFYIMKLIKQLIMLMCCTYHGFKKSYLNKIILNVYSCPVFYMVFKSYLNKTISTMCS